MKQPNDIEPAKAKTFPEVENIVKPGHAYNTKNLAWRMASDLTAAASAASLVAPIIAIIDKGIMENASGKNPLMSSIVKSFKDLLLSPRSMLFSKPVGLIFMLYGGTFLTANSLDTATSTLQNKPSTLVTTGGTKFAASSIANISLCVFKDQAFVRLFGTGPARPVSLPSYLLFTARDCMTIFASFNVPCVLGPMLDEKMGKEMQKTISGVTVAQFVAPASIQLLSTPIHLLGLDLYNRAHGVSWSDRLTIVKKNWAISAAARICRIVPAFGVGGTVNGKVRKALLERLD